MDWLQTWDPETAETNRAQHRASRLVHTASDQFPERAIAAGDRVFVAYIGDGTDKPKGHLFLIGRLIAESSAHLGFRGRGRGWITQDQAEEMFGADDIWEALGHVVSRESNASAMNFDSEVPPELLPTLTFLVRDGDGWRYSYLKLLAGRRLKQQTLRRVRRLHPESAKALERLIPDN